MAPTRPTPPALVILLGMMIAVLPAGSHTGSRIQQGTLVPEKAKTRRTSGMRRSVNGMIERFFRTLKEECLWHHRFTSRDEAFLVIAAWLEKYHTERPHSALGYLTPREFAEQLAA